MTAPLPDLDVDDLDAWIAESLASGDTEGGSEWRSIIVPLRAKTIGAASPLKCLNIVVTNEFAYDLYEAAHQRGLTRAALIRLILVDALSQMTGRTREDVLQQMPPRRSHAHKYAKAAPK
jgi:hypothetical protein